MIRLPALEIHQSPGRVLYAFAVDGKELPTFASVSRLRREGGTITGYQRPEILPHVAAIRRYLEGPAPMIANAVVVAFDPRVRFEPDPNPTVFSPYARSGVLVVPRTEGEDEKPGAILDGQQRIAAVRDAAIPGFPLCVTAFVAGDPREQTEHFLRINTTRKMATALLDELLPATDGDLPMLLERRRLPKVLLERLNADPRSPLAGKVLTATSPAGVVKSTFLLRMIENSMSNGALYRFHARVDEPDVETMATLLIAFFVAVSRVFEEAWVRFPRSLLLDCAGLVSLGLLMDEIADRPHAADVPSVEEFAQGLLLVRDQCHWTEGVWDFGAPIGTRRWDEVPPKDASMLAKHLLVRYKAVAPKPVRTKSETTAPPPFPARPQPVFGTEPAGARLLPFMDTTPMPHVVARAPVRAPVPPHAPNRSLREPPGREEVLLGRPDTRNIMLTESLRAAIASLAEQFVEQLLETVRPISLGDVLHMKSANGGAHAGVPAARANHAAEVRALADDDDEDLAGGDEEDEESPPTTRSPGLAKAKPKAGARKGRRTSVSTATGTTAPLPLAPSLPAAPPAAPAQQTLSRSRRRRTANGPGAEVAGLVAEATGGAGKGAAGLDGRAIAERMVDLLRRNPQGMRAEDLKEALRVERKALKQAIAEALASSLVSRQGQKRATTYFAR